MDLEKGTRAAQIGGVLATSGSATDFGTDTASSFAVFSVDGGDPIVVRLEAFDDALGTAATDAEKSQYVAEQINGAGIGNLFAEVDENDQVKITASQDFAYDTETTATAAEALTAANVGSANSFDLEASGTGSLSDLSVSTVSDANNAIMRVDAALGTVNEIRGQLGAVQNRFESTIANLSTSVENLSASNSRILDADFASETANLAKSQVLQQAGISVLAQANARPQQVLSLLQ